MEKSMSDAIPQFLSQLPILDLLRLLDMAERHDEPDTVSIMILRRAIRERLLGDDKGCRVTPENWRLRQLRELQARNDAFPTFSARTKKALWRAGVQDISTLTTKTADELMTFKGFGMACLVEVRAKLKSIGVRLKNDPD
jgi:hypothetical protein